MCVCSCVWKPDKGRWDRYMGEMRCRVKMQSSVTDLYQPYSSSYSSFFIITLFLPLATCYLPPPPLLLNCPLPSPFAPASIAQNKPHHGHPSSSFLRTYPTSHPHSSPFPSLPFQSTSPVPSLFFHYVCIHIVSTSTRGFNTRTSTHTHTHTHNAQCTCKKHVQHKHHHPSPLFQNLPLPLPNPNPIPIPIPINKNLNLNLKLNPPSPRPARSL